MSFTRRAAFTKSSRSLCVSSMRSSDGGLRCWRSLRIGMCWICAAASRSPRCCWPRVPRSSRSRRWIGSSLTSCHIMPRRGANETTSHLGSVLDVHLHDFKFRAPPTKDQSEGGFPWTALFGPPKKGHLPETGGHLQCGVCATRHPGQGREAEGPSF